MNDWRKDVPQLMNEVIYLDKIYDNDMAAAKMPTPLDMITDFIQSILNQKAKEIEAMKETGKPVPGDEQAQSVKYGWNSALDHALTILKGEE